MPLDQMDQMPVKNSVKKMWALRLSPEHMEMLKACAALSNANRTQFLEYMIEKYYKEVVLKKDAESARRKNKSE